MSRDPLVVGNVVGDILDPFIKSASLKVLYNNRELTNGSELKPSQVANEPRIEISGSDMRTLYTLDHPWPQCSSIAKGRTDVVADDTLDDIGITSSTGGLMEFCMKPSTLNG
ncbi:hypothetical protein C2845_PM12G19610 [Panicum miliaceum]|uniref:Uncharacterized protein n=1 Tax=Panicum miliaceum TaxID=4540 RepID=A0A3L6QKE0_PANMI|nr:hypothetical protein C2845_PM12G19610 [Panicum miliaceum]